MQLTKTDFIQYLNCPESLWLLKNKPEEYPHGEFSLFLDKLISEGYEVEKYAQQLFPNAVKLNDFVSPEETSEKLSSENEFYFQPSFLTDKGAFARVDILQKLPNGAYHLYEVKSSTSIKKDKKHNHLKDVCFQKYVLTNCGLQISKASIIHLNKDFIKKGKIDSNELLLVVDITDGLENIYSATSNEINSALSFIKKSNTLKKCSCIEKTRSNHCDTFNSFNPNIPEHSIYQLNRISAKKIGELRALGVLALQDVPHNYNLAEKQKLHILSLLKNEPVVNKHEITEALSKLKFPLHFIDYETYPTAIPIVEGFSPHQHLVFQVSIHTLEDNGNLTHYEYLLDSIDKPNKLITYMQNATNGNTGTFVSWHASFEISRNKEMINQAPEFTSYLEYMNKHMFDLEKLFFTGYVDYKFSGKTSIKNILPIIAPELSYKNLDIQNGTMALDTWGRLQLDPNFTGDINKVKQDLLDYCKLDTLAMVKIYEKVHEIEIYNM